MAGPPCDERMHVVDCPCGKRAIGTVTHLRSFQWVWSLSWGGWLCDECRVIALQRSRA